MERDDEREIRTLLERWVVWRDAGDWERFASVWHDDGRMMATWCQAPFADFIAANREGFARGVRILHFLGGGAIDVAGARAVAQTKMTISQRASVEGVLCDVVCTGRFYDFLERRDDRWGLVLRQPIYEKDRLDPVVPGEVPQLDRTRLEAFPEGYRHLAYLQSGIGYDVKCDMPGLTGPEVEALYRDGAAWLAGGPLGRGAAGAAAARSGVGQGPDKVVQNRIAYGPVTASELRETSGFPGCRWYIGSAQCELKGSQELPRSTCGELTT